MQEAVEFLENTKENLKSNARFTNELLEKIQIDGLMRLTQALFREGILSSIQKDNELILLLPNTRRFIKITPIHLGSFCRYLTFGKVYLHEKDGPVYELKDPLQLLNIYLLELDCEADKEQAKRLAQEIKNHLENAILSAYHHEQLGKIISQEAKEKNYFGLLPWVENQEKMNKSNFFEQWVCLGHPFHPGSKTKLGFSQDDVKSYSPEFQPTIPLIIAAIQKDYIHVQAMNNMPEYMHWFAFNYSTAYSEWLQGMEKKHLRLEEFIPLPIHPWQAEHIIPKVFNELIQNQTIQILDEVFIHCSPTLSFRTLAPIDNPDAAYIKLPVAIQATSQIRTLPTESVENVTKISWVLTDIFAKENNFSGRLNILREFYGLHLKNVSEEQAKHLNVIFRENPKPYLSGGETAIVLASLFEISPISQLPLFIELMRLNGIYQLKEALDYFYQYVDLVLGSYLDLYLLYNISLEGHQQNTLVVIQNNKIVRLIARDLEWAIFSKPYQGFSRLSKTYFARAWLLYMVYQLHLGELVLLLSKYFNGNEKPFWQVIKNITKERFFILKDKIDPEDWQTEYKAILETDWLSKALLRMRLQKSNNEKEIFFTTKNPLIDCD